MAMLGLWDAVRCMCEGRFLPTVVEVKVGGRDAGGYLLRERKD